MRKFILGSIFLYIVYGLSMWWYLFYGAETTLSLQYQGSAADPVTFMNGQQLKLSTEYSQIRNLIYFLSLPLEWGIYLLVLVVGLSSKFRSWACNITRFSFVQTAIYVFCLTLLSFFLSFPIEYYSYHLSQYYDISTQTFSNWMKDQVISFWVGYVVTVFVVSVIYYFIRAKKQRWWFYIWLLSIPFTLFMMYIQPVLIDPLYNEFYPLKDKELEKEILQLAKVADIPAERVYEVNMSEKTNALNAYVTGIGNHLRIVLWDTTLSRLDKNEVLFIMAHEMGHYVKHHLYWSFFGTIFLSFIGLFLVSRLLQWMINKWGLQWKVNKQGDIASLPAFLVLISLLSFAVSPVTNLVSRHYEHQADQYAIEMTKDVDGAIGAFQKLTIASLSQVNPPTLVKIFRYGHPTILERIHYLETEKNTRLHK